MDERLYVDNKNAEIKVIWSESVLNPYAILKGTGISGDGVANINCDVDDADFPCTQDQTDPKIFYYKSNGELRDGNYTFTIYANDMYGNPMDDFVGREFVIDTTAPTLENFSYMVSGTTQYGKVIEFIVDVNDNELLNASPILTIDDVVLSEVPATFLGNKYKYYYVASLSDTGKQVNIYISDRAGNDFSTSQYVHLTAPRPPITFPFEGSVISPYTNTFSFFYFERVPKTNMKILYNEIEISNKPEFAMSDIPILSDMLYYYTVNSIDGVNQVLTIEAWDDKNNRLGPYDIHFTVDPNALRMPSVYFDGVLANDDRSSRMISSNKPEIEIVFSDEDAQNGGINITEFKFIVSNYSYIVIPVSQINKVNSKTFTYQVDTPLPEGLTAVMFSACQINSNDHCIINAVASVIVNSRAPYITWVNPKGFNNAWASDEIMIIRTDEWAECKYVDRIVTSVNPSYFFVDELGRENSQYSYFENNNGYGGNGYTHDTKMVLSGGASSLPYSFNYSVVCKDMFGQYTPINYSRFSLDLNPPIIESIGPVDSITYYFVLNVTTNEDTVCKYILVNSTSAVYDFSSEDYESEFYEKKMFKIDDDSQNNSFRKTHKEIIDHTAEKGSIIKDGVYLIYVECADGAGNFAKNKQFTVLSSDLLKLTKLSRVGVDTSVSLSLSNLSRDGISNQKSSLLSFRTNRKSQCYFKFANMSELEVFTVYDPFLNNMPPGITDGYYHEVSLAGSDVLHAKDYYLPQYPNAEFPEGSYTYEIFCTTEPLSEVLMSDYYSKRTYQRLVWLNGSDPTNSKNYYTYSASHTFKIDTTPPEGLIVSLIYPDTTNPGFTYYTDRITYSVQKTNLSSDVSYFLTAVSTLDNIYGLTPDIMPWTNITSTQMTLIGLNLTDKGKYYVHVKGVDYAGNTQVRASVSPPLVVDVASRPTCNDTKLNNGETDYLDSKTECGGPNCDPCGEGKKCEKNRDCDTNYCALDPDASDNESDSKICQEYIDTCMNTIKDSTEADVDCGGNCIAKCKKDQACFSSADCDTLLYCNDFNSCDDSCGNEECESDFGEDESTCPDDCVKEDVSIEPTPQQKCKSDGKYWYDNNCHDSPKQTESKDSGFGLLDWLFVIFGILVLMTAGGFLYYTYYIRPKRKNTEQRNEQVGILRQPVLEQAPKRIEGPSFESVRKPYQKKRDLSLMSSFDNFKSNKEPNEEIKLEKKDKSAGTKEDKQQKKEPDKKTKLSDLSDEKTDFDELDKLGSSDLDELDSLSENAKNSDIDKLANLKDDFDELSKLIGEDNMDALSTIKKSTKAQIKKADLFSTLSSIKTSDKLQNKNIFQQVILYLIKSGKLDKAEVSHVLLDLADKNIIEKKDVMDVLYNIEKELK